MVFMNEGMKKRGEPELIIWETLLKQYHKDDPEWKATIVIHEDNTTAIIGAREGKNLKMKTLERSFGVSVGWINEQLEKGSYDLVHTSTNHMTADIDTKCMDAADQWHVLRRLI